MYPMTRKSTPTPASSPGFRERSRRAYASLSPAHRRIVEFLNDFPREAAFLSAAELGRRVKVSDATVVRLAPTLGYASYPDLRWDLQNSLIPPAEPAALLRERSAEDVGVHTVIGREIHNLEQLRDSLGDGQVDRTARLVHEADRVFVLGLRMMFGPAHSCALLLGQILRNTVLLDLAAGTLADQVTSLGNNDVLIAFSTSRYSRTIIKVVNFALSRQCKVIAVTDSALAPIAQVAPEVVLVSAESSSFFASAIAAQAYVNVLVSTIARRHEHRAAERLAEIETAIDAFQTLLTSRSDDTAEDLD